jgi:hypothetical protein
MMNFEGWPRYPANFELAPQHYGTRLDGKRREARIDEDADHTTISINSVFLEAVDKFYPWRGVIALFFVPLFLLAVFGCASMLWTGLAQPTEALLREPLWLRVGVSLLVGGVMFGGTAFFLAKFVLLGEVFAYTHYPVRLNRRNRMVYVFRSHRSGGVLAVKWDDVFWQLAPCDKTPKFGGMVFEHEIRGHVLDADGKTVRDTFSLGRTSNACGAKAQWEHFRQYMQGGPAQIGPQELLPIAHKRESFWFGLWAAAREWDVNAALLLLASPLWASFGLARTLAMLTCRRPRWPADVEAACALPEAEKEPRAKDRPARVGSLRNWTCLLPGTVIGWTCLFLFARWLLVGAGYTTLFHEWVG